MRLRSTLPLLALAAAIFPLASCSSGPAVTPSNPSIEQVVHDYMTPFLAANGAHGAIVGISSHGTRTFYTFGSARDDGTPFTPTTLVEIGSCTKVFTTTLFAAALNSGSMQPNVSAQTYMPPGYTLATPTITPLQLADFLSGMPDEVTGLTPPYPGIDIYTARDFLTWTSNFIPAAPITYQYSNTSVGLLAYLLEQANATPWLDQVKSGITTPLGMVDTETLPNAEQQTRLAQGHYANGNDARIWPYYAWFGAGVLRSTAQDMLSFGEANLGHTTVNGQPVPTAFTAASRLAQTPVYYLESGAGQALAWVVNRPPDTDLAAEVLKNGGTAGFSTVILTNPAKDTAIFIAVNEGSDESDGDPANPSAIAVNIGRHLPD